ncbi:hypothetical protein [Frankia sp. EI5c]|nr:hypothetical protein [Frankia sp. EI5c]
MSGPVFAERSGETTGSVPPGGCSTDRLARSAGAEVLGEGQT